MIADTTYLLPLARIEVETDLLKSIAEGRAKLTLRDLTFSLISIFELQAKASSVKIPVDAVKDSIEAIMSAFKLEPFYSTSVIDISFKLRKMIPDYIDCVIAATAAALKEDLVTEDSRILRRRRDVEEEYGIRVFSFKDLVR